MAEIITKHPLRINVENDYSRFFICIRRDFSVPSPEGGFSMNLAGLKRKIRKLKQFEKTIRANEGIKSDVPLVWDKFFDLHDVRESAPEPAPDGKTLYTLPKLAAMSREEYKSVVDDFFAHVYYEVYVYSGIIGATIYDPAILAQLGLPPVADEMAVKKKFRELAKKYHPDAGGDHEEFVALMRIYRELSKPV